MWAMLAAPLMAGNDLRETDAQTLKILTEKEVIAIDQDAAGIPAFRYMKVRDLETWIKPLAGGEWAVCFLNRGLIPQKQEVNWHELFQARVGVKQRIYSIRNIWEKRDIGTTENKLTINVPAEDVVLLRIKPID